ncbi:myosin regulatory light chain 2, atrial isoform isoform X2 [Trachemys scripta elegans]|uniref:myosin regulatory light chain 2, atrial isoform isoform X2 n=1 Tax=Trachemys scripta elegans TaxID=31138 RepID=UPI00155331DA|nr:myosin regulatory light chain 2, atrial isoform isoform X2 [Trachemys scripta elegans]
MASRKAGTRSKAAAKRAQRGSSNVFSMFEQSQIQEFKEAFSCIDQNRDGIITKSDLKETYSQLALWCQCSVPPPRPRASAYPWCLRKRGALGAGERQGILNHHRSMGWCPVKEGPARKLNMKDEELDEMLKEGKGPINFTVFLALFGEKLNGTDPEESILNAFKLFDPDGTGHVNKDEFKQLLLTQADKFTPEEVRRPLLSPRPQSMGPRNSPCL